MKEELQQQTEESKTDPDELQMMKFNAILGALGIDTAELAEAFLSYFTKDR